MIIIIITILMIYVFHVCMIVCTKMFIRFNVGVETRDVGLSVPSRFTAIGWLFTVHCDWPSINSSAGLTTALS